MNVPEDQRSTEAIKLRLQPEVAARFRALALAWGLTLAETVEELLARVVGEEGA